jgi:hypothetical protein
LLILEDISCKTLFNLHTIQKSLPHWQSRAEVTGKLLKYFEIVISTYRSLSYSVHLLCFSPCRFTNVLYDMLKRSKRLAELACQMISTRWINRSHFQYLLNSTTYMIKLAHLRSMKHCLALFSLRFVSDVSFCNKVVFWSLTL